MKKCENCKNEHNGEYGSGRFCEEKCAKSFTKVNRSLIGEKISKSLKKYFKKNPKKNSKKKCCSCDVLLKGKTRAKYCKNCKKFVGYKVLFDKLNVLDKNLVTANQNALEILCEEYFINKLSKLLIMDKYNLMSNTIYNYFKLNNISLRSLSEAQIISYLENRKNSFSSNDYKCGTHNTWENKKVYYRSSYELDYILKLDDEKIKYDMECLRIKYFDTQKNIIRCAIPDIYLFESNTIVEIKSTYSLDKKNMLDKIKEYKKLGYDFKLILNKDEVNIEEI